MSAYFEHLTQLLKQRSLQPWLAHQCRSLIKPLKTLELDGGQLIQRTDVDASQEAIALSAFQPVHDKAAAPGEGFVLELRLRFSILAVPAPGRVSLHYEWREHPSKVLSKLTLQGAAPSAVVTGSDDGQLGGVMPYRIVTGTTSEVLADEQALAHWYDSLLAGPLQQWQRASPRVSLGKHIQYRAQLYRTGQLWSGEVLPVFSQFLRQPEAHRVLQTTWDAFIQQIQARGWLCDDFTPYTVAAPKIAPTDDFTMHAWLSASVEDHDVFCAQLAMTWDASWSSREQLLGLALRLQVLPGIAKPETWAWALPPLPLPRASLQDRNYWTQWLLAFEQRMAGLMQSGPATLVSSLSGLTAALP